jgi:hypothetical protein
LLENNNALMWRVFAFLFIFLSFSLSGQDSQDLRENEASKLHYYFTLYCQSDGKLSPSFSELDDFINKLNQKRPGFKNEASFVKYLFQKSHQKYFQRFQEYSSFRDLISNGIYNCLSGSAFLALLLDRFEIEYKIMETNYHVFLLTSKGTILLETTDPNGFIDDPEKIKEIIGKYQRLSVDKKFVSKTYYEYSFTNLDEVGATEMLGLLHYNQAVKAYNEQQFQPAIAHLQHALLLHRSLKIEAFLDVMIQTVLNSGVLSQSLKEKYLHRLYPLRASGPEPVEINSSQP